MNTSEMTDQELNEAIAKAKGSVLYRDGSPASYIHDCNLTVSLLEEMKGMLYHVLQPGDVEQWVCVPKGRQYSQVFSNTIGRAVAEAWYQVFGEKE